MIGTFDLVSIERAAVQAWPALETAPLGGWLWRSSGGGSQRANSVATLAEPGDDIEKQIAEAERLYAARGLPAQFHVTQASVPSSLDVVLAERGYGTRETCTTLARAVDAGAAMPADVVAAPRADEDWLATYTSVITPDRQLVARAILARMPHPSAFLSVRRDDGTAATAVVVPCGRIAIVECVATRAHLRRTGAADAVMQGALAAAASVGCHTLALGAVATNGPAQALYAKLGFQCVGRYHVRVKEAA